MPINAPIVSEIAKNTFLINEYGLNVMFLLVGTDRALLIDTGTGVCDLKAIISSITRLPLTVVITHGHIDHAGAIGQFDEIYIHPKDIDMAAGITREERANYAITIKKMSGDVFAYGGDDVRVFDKTPKMLSLQESQVFDLGGRTVSVIETPGHTKGSCCLIDDKSRILFSGDACNTNLLLLFPVGEKSKEPRESASVSTELKSLLKIKAHEGEFDRNYNGHIGYAGDVTCRSLDDSVLDDCIACCKGIIDGSIKQKVIPNLLFGKPGKAARYGKVRIAYDEDYIFED